MLKYSIFLLFVFYSFSVVHASAQTWSTVPGAYGIAFDTDGNLFVSSTTQNEIVELYEGLGVPVRFAGTGTAGFVDGDALTEAQFNQPKGIIVYENSVYVCDYGNNAIRKIFNGQVSTLVSDVTGPVDVSVVGNFNYYSYWYWYNSNEQYVNPKGLYVTTDSGEVYFINEGPENDDCPYSQVLGTLSSTPFVVHGTTVDASGVTSVPTCPAGSNNIPFTPVWYSFMGNGNGVNITTCLSGTNSYAGVFVYRDPAPNSNTTCNHLVCMGENFHNDCGIVSLCTQVNMRYYVVVSSPYESEEGPFELSITDIGSNLCADCSCDGIECGNNACGGFCPNPGCTGGKVCVAGKCEGEAVNANCTGAIVIPSTNTSVSANTQFSVGPVPYIPAEGDCYFPENTGLWYSFVGTGTQVTLTTCSPVTDYDTIIHVYKSIDYYDSCGQFLCITENDDYSCRYDGTDSRVDFCSENGTVYYYFVEGFGHGAFQLTQTISPMACTPGDYWEYYFFYWDFFYWDFFYVFYFDEVTGLPITDQSPPKQLPIINDK